MVDETWVQIRSSQLPIFYNLFIDRRNMFQYFSGHVFSRITSTTAIKDTPVGAKILRMGRLRSLDEALKIMNPKL